MSHASSHFVRSLMPPSSWTSLRAVSGLLWLFVGIDVRRPASWIALAVGGWVGWWCVASTAAGSIVMLAAAVLSVAAIGDIPLAVCRPAGYGLPLFWACERAAWPLVGAMLGMLVAGGGPASFSTASAAAVGGLLVASTAVASRLSGAKAADAASLSLLLAAASAAAGSALATWLGGGFVVAVASWLLLGGLGWAWWQSHQAAIETALPGTHRAVQRVGVDVLHVDALPANGPLRQALTRVAMVAALVAMAGWLILEPATAPVAGSGHGQIDHGGQIGQWDRLVPFPRSALAWALFTVAWFIGLAVPQATLQDGIAGARGWEHLFRTIAGPRRGGPASRRGLRGPRPGPVRFAGGVALTQAAILGWPVLVCAVLSLPAPAAARLPLGIVVGLAVLAAVVSAMVWLGDAVHASRETTFAATLAITLAIGVGVLAVAADVRLPARQSAQPFLPSLPSSLLPPLQRLGGG